MKTKRIETVGELREFIKDLSDDTLIVNYQNDKEKSGYQNNMLCSVANMENKTKATYDWFDGTPYSYEVFVESKDGATCLLVN